MKDCIFRPREYDWLVMEHYNCSEENTVHNCIDKTL